MLSLRQRLTRTLNAQIRVGLLHDLVRQEDLNLEKPMWDSLAPFGVEEEIYEVYDVGLRV